MFAFIGEKTFSALTPLLYNNIIWGNTSGQGSGQIYLQTANSSPDIYNCIIQEGMAGIKGQTFTGKYVNNLDTDPLFIKSSAGSGIDYDGLNADWNLELASLFINGGFSDGLESQLSGKDFNNTNRIKYGQVDIGALEFSSDHIDITVNIINDTTWFADTVKVWKNFYVANEVTLKVRPGTIVQFQGKYKMDVAGTLLADGSLAERRKFTVADTTYFSNPDSSKGGWGGLRFRSINPANDSSSLSWCIFEYGKTGSVKDWDAHLSNDLYGGAILVYNFPKMKITSCQFRHNKAKFGGAISLENSDIVISKCVITDNYALTYGSIRVRCIDRGNKTREQIFIIFIDDVGEGTGIKTVKTESIHIYPNPFNENTIIRFNNPGHSNYTLYVTDITGKVVYSEDNT